MAWNKLTINASADVKDFLSGRKPEDVIIVWPDGDFRVFYKDVPANAGTTWALSTLPSDVDVKALLDQLALGGEDGRTKVVGHPQQGYRIFVCS
ncbi:MAG TPA: hypothetical protein VHR66_05235 [Gemmataceae bacterium]|jgi:hypothetical protein|nr:hypothetical protein [Gemmataceae bacterium]